MSVHEASSTETPFGRYITSDGWFVLNLGDALAVRNEEKGGASFPLESQEHPFAALGVHLRVLWPGDPNALYHAEGAQEGFLVLLGECTLIVEEEERRLRQWDYFHCPAGTSHVLVGAGDGPCSILMLGTRPDEPIRYPFSEIAASYGASVATETGSPDEAYADWPGDYQPVRLAWPPEAAEYPSAPRLSGGMSLPLSSLRVAGGFVFLSGQGGFDANHELVGGGVAAETAQIFRNVAALLETVGASLDDVVSCLVHLADLDDYAAFNDEYAKHFAREKPVRTTVRADLVAGMRVEITVVANQP